MKRRKLLFAAVGLSACVLYSSCIGSFGLFNKFAEINTSLTKSKFVNGILGFIFIPVYGVCLAADWVVLNTIEFWTGSNPIAAGTTQRVKGSDGREYAITSTKDGYKVQQADQSMELKFDSKKKTWSVVAGGKSHKLMTLKDNGTADVCIGEGRTMSVTLDAAGATALRQYAEGNAYAAR